MDNDNNEQQLDINTDDNNDATSTTHSSPTTAYNDIIATYSFSTSSSAFDSSSRLSTSSSISGWAPPSTSSRARSSSVSSQGSNDSVNLDALIAGGSDINEECPLDLEEGDDLMTVDWSKQQRFLDVSDDEDDNNPVQQGQRSRRSTGASFTSGMSYDDRQADDHWDEPEMVEDETLKGFSQLSMKHSIPAVRGLTSPKQLRAPSSASSRFPDGRNPYDLDADYLDTPSGLASPSSSNNRLSTLSQDSNISNRSSISSIGGSRLQPPGVSRLPGSSAASGLKAPASRLAQPGVRSTGVPQPESRTGLARPSGLQAPKSGLQAPKSGLQAPNTRLQAPRTASGLQAPRTGSSSSLVKPSTTGGRTTPGAAAGSRLVAPGSRVPSKVNSGIAPPSATRSQMAAPGTVKRAGSVDTVTPLSQRLSNATGTSQLVRPKTAGGATRSLSMYGSSSSLLPTSGRTSQQYYHQDEEADYAVLTPPQSPSSKRVMGSGVPRSGMAMPSRLAAPSVSTSRVPRSTSPSPLNAGYNSGGSSYLPRPHTPTSSLPVSRIPSGLISPRAGRS
ncbi:hypothetical protein BGX30_005831 [Mortierella sp. GBA39]|nr:hypothetical protein BGX30_005831 [Mortierella sp. GBA39]